MRSRQVLLLIGVVLIGVGVFLTIRASVRRGDGASGPDPANRPNSDRPDSDHGSNGSSLSPVANPWFVTVGRQSGVDFVHDSGASDEKPFPAANGSGLAAFDYDLDGRVDLYFATGTPFPIDPEGGKSTNRLYRNQGDWRFTDSSAKSGLDHAGYSAGVTVGDFDSDGFPDVYVACYGPNVLYRNQGDGTFQAVRAAGVNDSRWATSACMLDYDNDGLLDLYVCNYAKWTWDTNPFCGDRARGIRIFCSPHSVRAERDILYRNQGDGTFTDVTEAVGVGDRAGRAQGVVAADLDADGTVDLYVGNDLHANSLFLNRGDGTFQDASQRSGVAYDYEGNQQAGMGIAAGDTNGDGKLELLVTNFADEHNAFYENLGDGLFAEVADPRGLAAESRPWVGWGTALADFNLDGRLDVVVANGHVDDNLSLLGQTAPYAAPPLLWKNSNGRFEFLGREAGPYFEQSHVGRGLVVADLDNDGDQDLVIGHQDGPPALLRNQRRTASNGSNDDSPNSITVRLIGTRSNRDAVGATLTLDTGSRRMTQQVTHGGSYLSSHDPRLVFAVLPAEQNGPNVQNGPHVKNGPKVKSGPAEQRVIALEVRWPTGAVSSYENVQPGRQYVLIEPPDDTSPARLESWSLDDD